MGRGSHYWGSLEKSLNIKVNHKKTTTIDPIPSSHDIQLFYIAILMGDGGPNYILENFRTQSAEKNGT